MKILRKTDLPAWSWIVSFFGILFVCGSIAYMLYKDINQDPGPPDIEIEQKGIVTQSKSYLVQISITNKGSSAASQLVVEGALLDHGQTIETSTITIEYAPAESTARAGLWFSRDPRAYQLRIRSVGYEEP